MCEKYLDDRVIISENIKKMSKIELKQEIANLEKKIIDKKLSGNRNFLYEV